MILLITNKGQHALNSSIINTKLLIHQIPYAKNDLPTCMTILIQVMFHLNIFIFDPWKMRIFFLRLRKMRMRSVLPQLESIHTCMTIRPGSTGTGPKWPKTRPKHKLDKYRQYIVLGLTTKYRAKRHDILVLISFLPYHC